MFDALKRALRDRFATPQAQDDHAPELAIAALLVEVSRADRTVSAEEGDLIRGVLERHYAASRAAAEALLQRAHAAATDAVSTFEFTRVLNTTLSAAEKLWVIERLWEVAWADGQVERYEEALVRKVADLLYVPHADLVAARWRVAPPDQG